MKKFTLLACLPIVMFLAVLFGVRAFGVSEVVTVVIAFLTFFAADCFVAFTSIEWFKVTNRQFLIVDCIWWLSAFLPPIFIDYINEKIIFTSPWQVISGLAGIVAIIVFSWWCDWYDRRHALNPTESLSN